MEIITNANQVAALFDKLALAITARRGELFSQLGVAFVKDVQDRIKSEDDGRWAKASKWHRAKKGEGAALLEGAEDYVKYKSDTEKLEVYGETGADWSLSQHEEGFENEPQEGRVTIDIVDPSPLGLSGGSTSFSWADGRTGRTPARKIWTPDGEAVEITLPIASKWLEKVVAETLAANPGLGSIA